MSATASIRKRQGVYVVEARYDGAAYRIGDYRTLRLARIAAEAFAAASMPPRPSARASRSG